MLERGILSVNSDGVATNADKDSKASVAIARYIAKELAAETDERKAGQISGSAFEEAVAEYVEGTFSRLQHLRPGKWHVMRLGNRSSVATSDFAQYEHLAYLSELTKANRRLSTIIGNDYMVAPDVVVYRELYDDAEINTPEF